MMNMCDCLEATYALMSAPREKLTRTTYNVTAISFTPAQLAEAIQRQLPGFEITYSPDFRRVCRLRAPPLLPRPVSERRPAFVS